MRTPTRAAASLAVLIISTIWLAGCTPAPTPNYSKCPTPTSGQIRVAVVVDPSTLTGGDPSVVCVVVAAGANGLDALTARSARLGRPVPRLNASGLLCAIDARPAAPDCGVLGPDGYQYWGYYVGGASWSFATAGPAGRTLTDGAVEGWSFQNGSNGGAPGTASSFAALTTS